MLSTAIIAGALLAFALSFDEVIVTTFTAGAQNTLPLWIFGAILRGQELPEVNAVVVFVLILTVVPIAYAARISSGERTFGSGEPPNSELGSPRHSSFDVGEKDITPLSYSGSVFNVALSTRGSIVGPIGGETPRRRTSAASRRGWISPFSTKTTGERSCAPL
jgi:hypothetical protein